MRSIPLKHLGKDEISGSEGEVREYLAKFGPPIDYRAALVEILINPPGDGINAAQVRQRGKIADKIVDAAEYALLEDTEFEVLGAALHAARWRSASRNLRTFLDDIEGAEQVSVKVDN